MQGEGGGEAAGEHKAGSIMTQRGVCQAPDNCTHAPYSTARDTQRISYSTAQHIHSPCGTARTHHRPFQRLAAQHSDTNTCRQHTLCAPQQLTTASSSALRLLATAAARCASSSARSSCSSSACAAASSASGASVVRSTSRPCWAAALRRTARICGVWQQSREGDRRARSGVGEGGRGKVRAQQAG